MSRFAIRLLTLAICATALAAVPMVTPAKAEASSSKHIKKHKKWIQRNPGFGDPWSAGRMRPVIRPSGCPGLARSFECGTWPPSFEDDPDRKVSGTDAG
jgi:hypothetical protein